MKNLRKDHHTLLLEILLVLAIAAVVYLPNLSQATIYRDDWYYVMDRLIGGPGVYQEMFSIDRPARGPLFEAYFQLFGIQPFPYHMSSFLWRVAGGVAALWLFRQLWPHQRLATLMMALLFTLYPGYLRWMEGFENQPRILSSFLETLSIALTLYAIRTPRTISRTLAWIASILTGWAYIALVDFSFGMEVFRLLCVFLLVYREQESLSLLRRSILTIRAWAVAALIPLGFLFWRFFLFQNERAVTDVGLQLGFLFASPVLTGLWWLARLIQSVANVSFVAWGAPLFQNLFEMGLTNIMVGMLLAGVAVLFLWGVSYLIWKRERDDSYTSDSVGRWQFEAIWVGLAGVVAGVLPIIIANRFVNFAGYSHYALPASLAGVIVIVGTVFLIPSRNARFGLMAGLVFLAALTHYTASLRILHEEQTIANFWHQVVWRAPGIDAGTTFVVNYPAINYAEDVDAVAGPANFLYFPEPTNQIPAVYQLVALPQMEYITKDILAGGRRSYGYRTHVGEINYNNILVISQSTPNSCVHVIDAQWPRYSEGDSDQILLLGQYSNVENIQTRGTAPRPAEFIFGPEPNHDQTWCYHYQQAELALQNEDWEKIIQIGEDVTRLHLSPNDRIEWTPFLQAYAFTGDVKTFKATAIKMDISPFVRREACRTLLQMQEAGAAFSSEIKSQMEERLCHGKNKLIP
ncbi:MAG TPA: hypothetical protein VJ830_01565 [Anaerolineales bacterium]|nr:hypothetical protein [Anaerolineales bacterium]